MGFLLSIIAYLLFGVLALVNFPIVLFKYSKSRGFFRVLNEYWFNSAYDIDVFANYHYRCTLNMFFIKINGYKFGVKGETISSALGKNQLSGNLTFFGWFIVYILWLIDFKYWFKGGHCINSIMYTYKDEK